MGQCSQIPKFHCLEGLTTASIKVKFDTREKVHCSLLFHAKFNLDWWKLSPLNRKQLEN